MQKPTITILVPVYNEGRNIPKLVSELHAVTAGIDRYDFSLLFVDDGSSDHLRTESRDLRRERASCPQIFLLDATPQRDRAQPHRRHAGRLTTSLN